MCLHLCVYVCVYMCECECVAQFAVKSVFIYERIKALVSLKKEV